MAGVEENLKKQFGPEGPTADRQAGRHTKTLLLLCDRSNLRHGAGGAASAPAASGLASFTPTDDCRGD